MIRATISMLGVVITADSASRKELAHKRKIYGGRECQILVETDIGETFVFVNPQAAGHPGPFLLTHTNKVERFGTYEVPHYEFAEDARFYWFPQWQSFDPWKILALTGRLTLLIVE